MGRRGAEDKHGRREDEVLRIRLQRGGRKKRPYYRIVVAHHSAPRDGRFVERIGAYNPLATEDKSQLNVERARYWLGVGAQPSERVRKLMALHGIEFDEKGRPVQASA